MALYERLLAYDDAGNVVLERINLHAFVGMLAERRRGRVSNNQVRDGFNLSPAEVSELVALINASPTREEVEDVLYAGQARVPPYTSPTAVRTRFGV